MESPFESWSKSLRWIWNKSAKKPWDKAHRPLALERLEGRDLLTTVNLWGSGSVTEGGTSSTAFGLSRDSSGSPLTVNYTIGGTATNGTDYSTLSGSVTFGSSDIGVSIPLVTTDDSDVEGNETVILTLASGSYTIGTMNSGTVTINDNDSLPTVTVTTGGSASETGPANGTYTVSRTGPTTDPLTVNYSMSGTATGGGTDYATLSGSVTIGAGFAAANITLTPVDDAAVEGSETAILTISTSGSYSVGSPNSATITISDNDSLPTVTVSASGTPSETGPATGTYTVTRTGPTTDPLTVNYSMSGTATGGGTDYSSLSGSVTISAGNSTATVTLTPVDDATYEGTESATLNLSTSSAYSLGTPASATLNIADNDPELPSVSVTAGGTAPSENGPTSGTFTVSRTGSTAASLVVNYAMSGGATNGTDYSTLSGSVTIASGNTSATVTIAPTDDNAIEGTESAILTISASANYNITSLLGEATLNIADNEVWVTASGTPSEGGPTTGTYTLHRNGPTTSSLAVSYSMSGTATGGGADYATLSGSATIPAGQTSVTVTLTPEDDELVEGSETAILTVSAPSGYTVASGQGAATLNIADDEYLFVTADGSPSEVLEEPGFFVIHRPDSTASSLDVTYTMSGTATNSTGSDADYIFFTGTVTIPAGEVGVELVLEPIDDELLEGPETVILTLSAGSTYSVSPTEGSDMLTIRDGTLAEPPEEPPATPGKLGEPVIDPALCGCPIVQSGVVEQTGALFISHTASGLAFLSSLFTDAVIAADVAFGEEAEDAEYIEVVLYFDDFEPVAMYFDAAGLVAEEVYRFAMPFDTSSLAPGRYEYELEIIEHYAAAEPVVHLFEGYRQVWGDTEGVFGSGVMLAGLDRLYAQADGVSLVMGDGNQFWFTLNEDDSYTGQAGDPEFRSLVLEAGVYTLTTRSGNVARFSAAGLLQSRADVWGNETLYAYVDADEDGLADDISTITDVVGGITTYDYVDGLLATITDFAGRVTTLDHDGSGQLVSITDPDPDEPESGQEPAVSTFGYTAGQLTTYVNASGSSTAFAWDHAGGLESRTTGGESKTYTNERTASLVDTSGGSGLSLGSLATLVLAADVAGSLTDEESGVTSYTTDKFGGRLSETGPLGASLHYVRNDQGLVTQVSTDDPDGEGPDAPYVWDYEYDEFGNVTLSIGPGSAITEDRLYTSYTYDETWHVLTSEMSYNPSTFPSAPLSWTIYTLDEGTGAVLEVRRVMGLVDDELNEETDDAVETYTYTAAPTSEGDPPAGLVATYTDPGGFVTAYDYNELGLVIEIVQAVGTADEGTLAFEYDSFDNLTAEIDELGRRTEHTYDHNHNRLSTTLPDPDGPGEGNPLASPVFTWQYNAMGRVILAVDPLGRELETTYGAFGNVTAVDWTDGVSSVSYAYAYDDAGRLISQTDALSRTTSFTLDAAGRTLFTTLPDPDGPGGGNPLESPVYAATFDPLGRTATTTDALGNVTTVSFSNYGRTVTTTLPDPDGSGGGNPLESPVLVQVFDAAGRLSQTFDARGGVTTYYYDMLGRVIQAILPDPDGSGGGNPLESPVFNFFYDAASNLIAEEDALGNFTYYAFDARHRLVEKMLPDPDGSGGGNPLTAPEYHWTYDAASQLISEEDPLGRITTHVLDNLGREIQTILPDPDGPGGGNPLESPVWQYTFDAANRLLSTIAPNGGVTTYEYDLLDNLVHQVLPDPDGSGEGNPLASPEYFWVYDAASQLVSEEDPLGRITLHNRDHLGREIETVLPDPDGPGGGNPLESPVWQFTFDANSNLISTVDPLGNTTTRTLDNLGRQIALTLPDPDGSGGGNPLTSPVYQWVFDASSNVISEIDPLGRTTQHEFDFLGRKLQTILPDPDGPGGGNPLESPVWQFSFDANSNLISTVDPLGNTTTRTLDNLGRQITLTLPDPDGSGEGNPLTSPVYQWVYDAASQVTSEIDPLGGVTQHVLDNLGRRVQTILPDPDGPGGGNPLESPIWQFSFDVMSNLVSTVDPMAAETVYEFDLLNRRIKTIDAESGETSLVFDAVNNLVSLTDSVGNTTTWFRDNLNRVIEEENENEDSRYFQYDAASNLTQRTDRNGRVTQWDHDNLGRTIAERWMDGVTPLHTITYVLDAASQLTEVSDSFSSFAFLYDDLGRVDQETQGITGLTPEIVFAKTWDASGNRLSLSATIGEEADFQNVYAHDNLHRITQIVQQGQSGGNAVAMKRFDFGYNALGQYSTLDRYQSADTSEFVASTAYNYDLAHRLASLMHSQGETVLAGYDFTYDAASRIDSIDSVIDGLSTFTYDATSQLTEADYTGQADESHVWDANGNPMGEDFEVGPNNRLLEDAAFLYEYDAEGNLIKKTDKVSGDYMTFEWDYRNRLSSVKFYDSEDTLLKTVDHSYDLFNRWVRRTVDNDGPGGDDPVDTFFAGYDGLDATLLFEGTDAEDLANRYAWGPAVDQLLAAENVDSLESAGDIIWPFTDQLGTPRDLATYDSGENETSIANHRVYNASGSLTSETNSSVVLVFSFTGKPLDSSTGFIQFVNRWYDPHTQRWLSPDPLGLGPDTNDVRYVGNNVTSLIDPLGLASTSVLDNAVDNLIVPRAQGFIDTTWWFLRRSHPVIATIYVRQNVTETLESIDGTLKWLVDTRYGNPERDLKMVQDAAEGTTPGMVLTAPKHIYDGLYPADEATAQRVRKRSYREGSTASGTLITAGIPAATESLGPKMGTGGMAGPKAKAPSQAHHPTPAKRAPAPKPSTAEPCPDPPNPPKPSAPEPKSPIDTSAQIDDLNAARQRIAEQIREVKRRRALGEDPKRGHLPHEESAALKLEKQRGITLRRDQSGNADWVGPNNKTYDLLGPFPKQYLEGQIKNGNLLEAFKEHTTGIKTDFAVVDFSGLDPSAIQQVEGVISQLTAVEQSRIIRLK